MKDSVERCVPPRDKLSAVRVEHFANGGWPDRDSARDGGCSRLPDEGHLLQWVAGEQVHRRWRPGAALFRLGADALGCCWAVERDAIVELTVAVVGLLGEQDLP